MTASGVQLVPLPFKKRCTRLLLASPGTTRTSAALQTPVTFTVVVTNVVADVKSGRKPGL